MLIERKYVMGLLPLAALLLLWQLSATHGWVQSDNWPAITQVIVAFTSEVRRGDVLIALAETIALVTAGFVIGAVAGITAAILASLSSSIRSILTTIVETLRPIPVPALLPPLVLLFGTEFRMKLIVVAVSVLFPVFLNTAAGIVSLDPQLRLVAKTLHMRRTAFVRDLLLPAALPAIFSGLRIGLGIALVVAVTAEIIVGGSGIGHYLLMMQFATRPAEMYGAMLALAALAYAINLPLIWVESACIFWRRPKNSQSQKT